MRLALATALCVGVSYGAQLPVPMVAPVMAVYLCVSMDRALSPRAGVGLALMVMATTGSGLLIAPILRQAPFSGVLITGLCLFLAFRHGLRGGNALVSMFLAAGVTLIAAAGTTSTALALTVVEGLGKGLLCAAAALGVSVWLIPGPAAPPRAAPPSASAMVPGDADRLAWRATLVVMPTFLLAMTDPAGYLPIVMKAIGLARQSCTTARQAALELVGSTLMGGVLAMAFWLALGLFVHLWMYCLWMACIALLVGRRLFGLRKGRASPGFWSNSLVTMIILLGQSVEDSAAGKDVYRAFAIRMALFTGVSLYAYAMALLLDWRRSAPRAAV